MEVPNPEQLISQVLSRASAVKLNGGVVGRMTVVLLAFILLLTALVFKTDNPWMLGSILGVAFIVVPSVSLKLIAFADKNPQAALLEGAELLVHEQLKMASKSNPALPQEVGSALVVPNQEIRDRGQNQQDQGKEEGNGTEVGGSNG